MVFLFVLVLLIDVDGDEGFHFSMVSRPFRYLKSLVRTEVCLSCGFFHLVTACDLLIVSASARLLAKIALPVLASVVISLEVEARAEHLSELLLVELSVQLFGDCQIAESLGFIHGALHRLANLDRVLNLLLPD